MSLSGQTLSSHHLVAWADKFLPAVGLLITTIVSCTLLGLQKTQWYGSVELTYYVAHNRTIVAIVVQVVSHVLGMIQVQALCAVVRTSFLASIRGRDFSLHAMQFVHALTTPKFSTKLPWLMALPLVPAAIFSLVPAAVWSAALTPVVVNRNVTNVIKIPVLRNFSSTQQQVSNQYGLFSFDSGVLQSQVKVSASDASITSATDSKHQKLDKTGFAFRGRSYGAGSAVGFDNGIITDATWYTYSEIGYKSQVSCYLNTSMNFRLQATQPALQSAVKYLQANGFNTQLFVFNGTNPNGSPVINWVQAGEELRQFFAWTVSYTVETRSLEIAMSTPAPVGDVWSFAVFNATQCMIKLNPAAFNVMVNVTDKSVNVVPGGGITNQLVDEEKLFDTLHWWVMGLSYADNTLGGSNLGKTLRTNVRQLMIATPNANNETLYRGISDYVASVVDDSLVALAAANYFLSNATTTTTAEVIIPAVVLGRSLFVYMMMAYNLIIAGVWVIEALRTRLWKDVSELNLMDLSSVTVAGLKGGMTISGKPSNLLSRYHPINDNDESNIADGMRVRLSEYESCFPAIVPVVIEHNVELQNLLKGQTAIGTQAVHYDSRAASTITVQTRDY